MERWMKAKEQVQFDAACPVSTTGVGWLVREKGLVGPPMM
jgi:hypothetical protein